MDVEALLKLKRDPSLWAEVAFERPIRLQGWQRAAFSKVASNPRVSIASCNGAGKSFFDNLLMLWFLTTREPTKVVVTAGSANQLSDVLWSEAGALIGRMRPIYRDHLRWQTDKISIDGRSDCFAVARTSRREQPDALQGHHARNMLFVLDEASGIPDVIIEVSRGSLSTPGARIVATGNPLRRQGWFYESHSRNGLRWACMNVCANERLAREYGVSHWADPGQVSDELVEEVLETYGAESAQFRSRVLGLFPEADADVLIPATLVEGAFLRDVEDGAGDEVWGVDVARFGSDRSALCKRRGRVVPEPIRFIRGHDVMQVTGWVKAEYDAASPLKKPSWIYVDVIGIGAGVVDRLRELGLPVIGVNVAESAPTKSEYLRLRDELWFRALEFFRGKDVFVAEDRELLAELTAPTYTFHSSGRMVVEAKAETKKRLGMSPDKADAFCLTFAGGASIMSGGFRSAWRSGQPLRRRLVGVA